MLLSRDGHSDGRWSFEELGTTLGEKHRLVTTAAQRGGELGNALAPYAERLVADELGVTAPWWANARAGRVRPKHNDYVYASHLRALAKYFHLDADHYFGPDAWLAYTPEVTVAEFEKQLLEVGYGGLSFMRAADLRPADSLLAWLRTQHEMTRTGISVTAAREFGGQSTPTRAVGVMDEVTEEEEESIALFRPGDRIKVALTASKGWHVVLLQLTDAIKPPFFALHCLAPSYRNPETSLSGGTSLPTLADTKGRLGFGLGSEPGRVDLIAILTRDEPLHLPFAVPESPAFHVIDPGQELQHVKGALNRLPAHARRVLHGPLRVA